MRRERKIIRCFCICLCALIFTACKSELQQVSLEAIDDVSEKTQQEEIEWIYVHVCGAVVQEGVYRLEKGSRCFEAIELAGGFREDAACEQMNQAQILEDEAKVYVPTRTEIQNEQGTKSGKINLNLATKEDLMTLPGVGEAKAEQILQYRTEKGGFQRIEDIMEISGIKEGLFQKIKELITV